MNPKPKLEPMPERAGDLYRLAETYRIRLPVDGRTLTIRAGYPTDGASIPRVLWRLAHPFQPRFIASALTHDALYSSELLPRNLADEIFRRLLREDGVPRWKARAMWLAVRGFGWLVWRGHTAASVRKAGQRVHFGDQWCAMCGKWGEHSSGSCPELAHLFSPAAATATPENVDRCGCTSRTAAGEIDLSNKETKRITPCD